MINKNRSSVQAIEDFNGIEEVYVVHYGKKTYFLCIELDDSISGEISSKGANPIVSEEESVEFKGGRVSRVYSCKKLNKIDGDEVPGSGVFIADSIPSFLEAVVNGGLPVIDGPERLDRTQTEVLTNLAGKIRGYNNIARGIREKFHYN